MEKLEILFTILFVWVLGSLNSLLSYFLEYCFWEGSIFGGYLHWLAKWNLKFFKKESLKALSSAKKNPEYNNMLTQSASDLFFFKILGGCVICSNVWLGFFTFTFCALIFNLHPLYALPYLLFSSALLRRLMKNQ